MKRTLPITMATSYFRAALQTKGIQEEGRRCVNSGTTTEKLGLFKSRTINGHDSQVLNASEVHTIKGLKNECHVVTPRTRWNSGWFAVAAGDCQLTGF